MVTADDLGIFLDALVTDRSLFPLYDADGNLLKTFCNLSAMRRPAGEVFNEFDAPELLADGMYAIMAGNSSGHWKKGTGAEAQAWAAQGGRAHGAMTSDQMKEAHGHIVRIRPDPMQDSGSLGHPVPVCANCGKGNPVSPFMELGNGQKTKPNWTCRTSQAFPIETGECSYFLYID